MQIKRLPLAVLAGALLGIFCIIGVGGRLGFEGNELFLFATWYNRVLMGVVIGVLPKIKKGVLLRGVVFGLLISLAFLLSTGLRDWMGFFAGIAYGAIIDFTASKYAK
ncbi:MAG: hypothetical protein JW791_03830 [Nanoarchaeota archaeon]|nr:hypothetical protein [Nanoarchaeota archaeon]